MRRAFVLATALSAVACSARDPGRTGDRTHAYDPAATLAETSSRTPTPFSSRDPARGEPGQARLTAHFYDVGQGLAVLVDLPRGEHVLVDTGDRKDRPGCGPSCSAADQHLIARLREDLRGAPIDLLWITHPHSDHLGGAEEVLATFPVRAFVDNGRDPRRAEVARVRRAARDRGAVMAVIEPGHTQLPMASPPGISLTAIVPSRWPSSCARDANECSIGLRIDFGASSVLFTGDAEHDEEGALDPGGPVTLLQVGHHGSDTSTGPAFLARVRPRYAVVSAGEPDEGLNREYCHPRALVVRRLTRVLGGPSSSTLQAFDGDRCDRAQPSDWVSVATSDALWATERDGDVVLTTTGDGAFHRR
ncbi:MAG TPA: MBL fold metallo-hydrolase [Polyangiaceae bacterium]|nr:MBL fold metallo-hydrolase [Polyangiaceae bacterium]